MKKSIKELKNKYRDKRVFLIGNGPSLKDTPLDKLDGEFSIAMNRIAMIYKDTLWRPSFFICTTSNISKPEWKRDILASIDLGITSFLWDRFKPLIGERENVYYLNCTHGAEITSRAEDDWWSDDISERVCKFGTSMLVAMQVAKYLGFNPMFLLGCDLGFKEKEYTRLDKIINIVNPNIVRNDKNHFLSNYGTPGLDAKRLNSNMLAAHKLAYKNLNKKGFDAYNSTIGGDLEIYPRKDIFEILKGKC